MAKRRTSVRKREREMEKRQRERKKQERAAAKRERRLTNDHPSPSQNMDVLPTSDSVSTPDFEETETTDNAEDEVVVPL